MKKKQKSYLFLPLFVIFVILLGNLTTYLMYPKITISHPNITEYYNDDDELITTISNKGRGYYVELKNVSPSFIKTLICIEDKRFYEHDGFDYLRILKSTFTNIINQEITQGASTISQQVARLIYLNNEKTFSRKIHEAIITKRLEETYSKDSILELYINSTYYAHNIYGLKAASNFYFNKEPRDLNYQESALLVGIINGPNIYSPFINYEKCLSKIKQIAYTLLSNKIITAEVYYDMISLPLKLYGKSELEKHPYYIDAITRELFNERIMIDKKYPIGMKVKTYLNSEIQSTIEQILSKYTIKDDIAIVIMKPYSGKVISLVGGKSYKNSQYNRAIDSKRQIGSTIKPLIYYLALENGMSPLDKFTSEKTSFILPDGSIYSPKNANDIYANRMINMIEAIAMSDNIYALKTLRTIKINSLVNLLLKFNIPVENPNLTLGLGTIELTPLELTSIYNTFASEGVYYQPKFIEKVTTHTGFINYQSSFSSKTLLKKDTTIMLNYLLQSPFDRALITYSSPTMKSYDVKVPFCVKTGTTDSTSWTIGFNKEYTICVYIGSDDNSILKDTGLSKKIFHEIVSTLTSESSSDFYDFKTNYRAFKIHNPIYDIYSKPYIKKVSG